MIVKASFPVSTSCSDHGRCSRFTESQSSFVGYWLLMFEFTSVSKIFGLILRFGLLLLPFVFEPGLRDIFKLMLRR